MRRSVAKIVVMAMATVGLAFLGEGTATAADSGQDYGQHVRTCVQEMHFQEMHFDGMLNPGAMHQGFAGWNPEHAC